jgi:hypothetical protein
MPLECKPTGVIFFGVFPTVQKMLRGAGAFGWLATS